MYISYIYIEEMMNEKKECCILCETPLKIKGLIISGLLIGSSIATSVLTFTTNCENVIHLANNQTMTVNDIGTANKVLSLSLLVFSCACAVFERFINKKVAKLEMENESLSVELAITKAQTNRSQSSCEMNNEPIEIYNTGKSDVSFYPPPLIFRE